MNMFAPIIDEFATEVATYLAAVEAATPEKDSGYKSFLSSLTPSLDFLNDPEMNDTPEQLYALRNHLLAALETTNDLLETHYYASRPSAQTNSDTSLDETHKSLKAKFKALLGFVEAGAISLEDLQSKLPVEMVKKGRAIASKPTLVIPKAAPSVRLRANSKRLKLTIDGVMVEEDNLSAAILSHLGMSFETFKDLYGTFDADHSVTYNDKVISLTLVQE